jgi:hypothetical protein
MIMSRPQAVLFQSEFRHVHVSSSIEITMEFPFVGLQGCRDGAIGSDAHSGLKSGERFIRSPLDLGLFTVRRAAG